MYIFPRIRLKKPSIPWLLSHRQLLFHSCEVKQINFNIGVRDQFHLGGGGLRSVARIFYPLLARKSSGFARILHGFFVPENCHLKNSRGCTPSASPPPPPPRLVRLWTYQIIKYILWYIGTLPLHHYHGTASYQTSLKPPSWTVCVTPRQGLTNYHD